jgi:hypothetical protein
MGGYFFMFLFGMLSGAGIGFAGAVIWFYFD